MRSLNAKAEMAQKSESLEVEFITIYQKSDSHKLVLKF